MLTSSFALPISVRSTSKIKTNQIKPLVLLASQIIFLARIMTPLLTKKKCAHFKRAETCTTKSWEEHMPARKIVICFDQDVINNAGNWIMGTLINSKKQKRFAWCLRNSTTVNDYPTQKRIQHVFINKYAGWHRSAPSFESVRYCMQNRFVSWDTSTSYNLCWPSSPISSVRLLNLQWR